METRYLILVHGGAGRLSPADVPPEREGALRAGLRDALQAAAAVLTAGGSALDAAVAAVVVLEDHPEFNAGCGAVLNREGAIELDASVMEGTTRQAGAVAAVRGVRHPVHLALAVLRASPHVLLVGEGAQQFAASLGMTPVAEETLRTPARQAQWDRLRTRIALDHADSTADEGQVAAEEAVKGTVGAVVRDRAGRLAAATSTGGMVHKWPGRVGDSALIGAGTWAWDRSCAVSATGHGERFIQANAAGRLSALVELGGLSLRDAAERLVLRELVADEAEGGLIAVDAAGDWAMPFNAGGMLRGLLREGDPLLTGIWEELLPEPLSPSPSP